MVVVVARDGKIYTTNSDIVKRISNWPSKMWRTSFSPLHTHKRPGKDTKSDEKKERDGERER